jgi:hypothetical protein
VKYEPEAIRPPVVQDRRAKREADLRRQEREAAERAEEHERAVLNAEAIRAFDQFEAEFGVRT